MNREENDILSLSSVHGIDELYPSPRRATTTLGNDTMLHKRPHKSTNKPSVQPKYVARSVQHDRTRRGQAMALPLKRLTPPTDLPGYNVISQSPLQLPQFGIPSNSCSYLSYQPRIMKMGIASTASHQSMYLLLQSKQIRSGGPNVSLLTALSSMPACSNPAGH